MSGSSRRLTAITAVPGGAVGPATEGRFTDEDRRAAELLHRYLAVEHRIVASRPRNLFDNLQEWHRLFDRPVGNYCNHLWVDRTYEEAAAAGADVMLVGIAGNFSFSFDGRLGLADLLGRLKLLSWHRLARQWRRTSGCSRRSLLAQSIGPFLPEALWTLAVRFARTPRIAGGLENHAFLNTRHPLVRSALQRAEQAGVDVSTRGERGATQFRLRAFTQSDPGNLHFALWRKWGVSSADPAADRRLMEFCLRLPVEHYFDGGHTRLLARRMLEGRMPDRSRLEEGKGAQGADWRCSAELSIPSFRAEIAAIAADPILADLFDHRGMAAALDSWPAAGWEDPVQDYTYRTKLIRTLACANWLRTAQ